jgi:hypothetical protein
MTNLQSSESSQTSELSLISFDESANRSNPPNRVIKRRPYQISDTERKLIPHQHTKYPGKQLTLVSWFFEQIGYNISQSIVSRTLFDTYKFLDNDTHRPIANSKRHYNGKWPDLDIALFEWQVCCDISTYRGRHL